MKINVFDTVWAIINIAIAVAIPLIIICMIIFIIRSIKGINKRLDSIEEKLKDL